jgi:murein DD-endopeptidase MepM/ murein hydrolase activator NlpD
MRKIILFVFCIASCTSGPDKLSPVIGNLSWPTYGVISQEFYGDAATCSLINPGYYYDENNNLKLLTIGRMHRAIDIADAEGVVVCAAADGVARLYPWDGKSKDYGNHVVVDHGKDLYTLYAHLRAFKILDGKQVKRGELIGEMGSTGNSTGPHLHFEVRHDPNPKGPTLSHFIPGKYGDKVLQGGLIPFNY